MMSRHCLCPFVAITLHVTDAATGVAIPDAVASRDGMACTKADAAVVCDVGASETFTLEVSAPGYASRSIDVTVGSAHAVRCLNACPTPTTAGVALSR